jgi:demethylmenaquinone methyltransferase / 2-methoxy-6-polyprenyl-1,4-benzoquinol methylase
MNETLPPHPLLTRYHADEGERRRQVKAWFDGAAADYDWVNQGMSLGSGTRYRRQALLRAGLGPGMSVLDAGTGTGVLAAEAREIVGPGGRVVALDPSLGMLRKAGGRGVRRRVLGVGEALPFAAGRFDLLAMGYALRHVSDLRATFSGYRRALRPGGKLLLLEITPPRSRVLFHLLKLYLGRLVPLAARLGRGGRTSQVLMEYYWDTIEHCVAPPVILRALEEAGFTRLDRHVEMGICSEYTAVR